MNTPTTNEKLIDLNFNIPKNFCKMKLIKELHLLEEIDIDNINTILYEELSCLDNNSDIYLFIESVLPIQIWFYIISIPTYIKSNLYIYTKEDIQQIKSYFELPSNCLLFPMD